MVFSISSIIMAVSAFMVMFFSYTRYEIFQRNRSNKITFFFWCASSAFSLALLLYALSGVLLTTDTSLLSSFIVSIALIITSIGIGFFLMIPFYSWGSAYFFVFAKYSIYLFLLSHIGFLLIYPPAPYTDLFGITHWGIHAYLKWILGTFYLLPFVFNIVLLVKFLLHAPKKFQKNTSTLIIAFLLTGIGGSYQYIGDDTTLLTASLLTILLGSIILLYNTFITRSYMKEKDFMAHHG